MTEAGAGQPFKTSFYRNGDQSPDKSIQKSKSRKRNSPIKNMPSEESQVLTSQSSTCSTPKPTNPRNRPTSVIAFQALTDQEKELHARRKKRMTFAGIDKIHSDVQEPENSQLDIDQTSDLTNRTNLLFNTSSKVPVINSSRLNESSFINRSTQKNNNDSDLTIARLFLEAEEQDRQLSPDELAEKRAAAQKIDQDVDFNEIQENFKQKVHEQILEEKRSLPRNHRRRRSNYCQIRDLDDESQVFITSTVLDPDEQPKIEDLLVTVVKKIKVSDEKNSKEHEFEIFVKQIPNKEWEDCTDEELEIIAKTDFTAKDILEKVQRPAGFLPLFFVEYPLPGEGRNIRTFGTIGFDGEVNIRDVRRTGFGKGIYPTEYVATALTGLRCGLAPNVANQMRVATNFDIYESMAEMDYVFAQVLNPVFYPGSAKEMGNLMDKVLSISDEKVKQLLSGLEATTICFDTKGIKFSKHDKDKSKLTREVITILGAGKYDKDDVTIAATGTLRDVDGSEKSAAAIAGTIRAVLDKIFKTEDERKEFYSKCIACCFDTTSTNTGWRGGACEILQHVLRRCLLMLACRNHLADTAAKHAKNF